MKIKRNTLAVFLLSIGVGALAPISWNIAFFPVRWYGEFTAYLVFVGIIGYLFGRLSKEKPWLWPIGIAVGYLATFGLIFIQVMAHFGTVGNFFWFWFAALVKTSTNCWPAFVGSFLGYGVMRLVRHLRRQRSEPNSPL